MKILITAATEFELKAILDSLDSSISIKTLVTGVGMVATAFYLGKHLANNSYDLVVNVGIAGAFNRSLELGEVLEVDRDQFSELGAEDGADFLTLEELGLGFTTEFPFENSLIHAKHNLSHSFKKVRGITVNKVHGNENSIVQIIKRFNPDIESMEGAAFLYACQINKLNCIQLRAISNFVEKRNKNAWEIDLALKNLGLEVNKLLKIIP